MEESFTVEREAVPQGTPARRTWDLTDLARQQCDSPLKFGDGAYKMMIERVRAPLFISQAGEFVLVNPTLAELFGYSIDEMMASVKPLDLADTSDHARIASMIDARAAGAPDHAYEISCVRKDGSVFSARAAGTRIAIDGRPADLVNLTDISEVKRAMRAAEQGAQLLVEAEELARMGSAETDLATGEVKLSAGMCRVFGEAIADGPVGREWFFSRVPPEELPFVRSISEGVRPGVPCEFEHRIVHADGRQRVVLHRSMVEEDALGQVVRAVTILQDITDQRAAEQRLDVLTHTCEVTGLPNRGALLDHLDAETRQARREGRSFPLIVLDIDQLKFASESLGYAGCDRLLAAVGARLRDVLSARDTLAHLGSGEYAVLLAAGEVADEVMALSIAAALAGVFAAPFSIDDSEVKVTCGVGVALCPRDDDDADKLLHQAEAAMHRAHEMGDNQVCVYEPDRHLKAVARLAMETALRRATEQGAFTLLYQPQLDMATGAVIGVEALIRWNDPMRGNVSPVEFIPIAEEAGLIVPIGEWVLRTACAQNAAWQSAGLPPLRMAVNLSVCQLQQPDIARRIQSILLETRLDPCYLGVEITESVLVDESAHVARMLGELKAIGVEISLDDFGTGYSNLSYLRKLPIDVVKIDRSFVHDVTAAPQDVSMTRAVINMAHSLQKKVLAEGVETEGQLTLLIANRCDQMQGYYFSPPVPADAVAEMLREHRQLPEHLLQRTARARTLLLVDDEENILAALKRLLRREGYHVVTATSGAQGLQRLAENRIDVILSDQRMPGMTGVEFLRRAKELYPDTIRMVLSGYTELQSITDAVNEGAIYKFLTKPWDDERLRGHIQQAFRHKEMEDENRRLASAVSTANQELADVNQRLQHLLHAQRDEISREGTSLAMVRGLLQSIPAPVVGFDTDDMVAFVNAEAEDLFCAGSSILGCDLHQVLPHDLLALCESSDGAYHAVTVAGMNYQAVCRVLDAGTPSRGKLLLLAPSAAALPPR
ncbi:MAG: EAL domain-containing protein [Rhizobiales bacterium]|nr:EAL domain-containing protein [Rhizobacter sp.]